MRLRTLPQASCSPFLIVLWLRDYSEYCCQEAVHVKSIKIISPPKEMFCSLIESIHFLDDVLKTAPSLFRQNKEEIIGFYKPLWIDPGIFRWNTNIHEGL